MHLPQPRHGGELRLWGDPELPEPVATHQHPMTAVTRLCARQLFTYRGDDDPESWQAVAPVPDLAAAIPSIYNAGVGASYTSYVVHLRPDVNWDTDPVRPCTAHDVVRGLKRLCSPFCRSTALPYFTSTIRGMAEFRAGHPDDLRTAADLARYANSHEISGVFALDDETLVIELLRPALDLIDILALPCASPVPVEYDGFLPDSADARQNIRSTGPYRPVAQSPDRLVLAHNPNWHAASDPVRRRYPDTITVTRDGAHPHLDLWPPGGRHGARHPSHGLDPYLALNARGPGPLRSAKVRAAIAHAIDRAAAAELAELSGEESRPAYSIIPPGSIGHESPTGDERRHGNPDLARALLAEVGYPTGHALTVVHLDTPRAGAAARSVAADLAKAGATTRLHALPWHAYTAVLTDPGRAAAGDWDIAVRAWYPDWLHANGRAYLLPLCRSDSTANTGGPEDRRVDELIDGALAAQEEPARALGSLRAAQQRVLANTAVVPVAFRRPPFPAPCDPAVRGVGTLSALGGAADLSTVWLDPPERESTEVRP